MFLKLALNNFHVLTSNLRHRQEPHKPITKSILPILLLQIIPNRQQHPNNKTQPPNKRQNDQQPIPKQNHYRQQTRPTYYPRSKQNNPSHLLLPLIYKIRKIHNINPMSYQKNPNNNIKQQKNKRNIRIKLRKKPPQLRNRPKIPPHIIINKNYKIQPQKNHIQPVIKRNLRSLLNSLNIHQTTNN
jgi:hypothetical protein